MPAGVTVIHNPLVRQPMQILCDTVDLEEIGKVDPAIASVAADLGFGIGLKGGIARKLLKILHGTPEPRRRSCARPSPARSWAIWCWSPKT